MYYLNKTVRRQNHHTEVKYEHHIFKVYWFPIGHNGGPAHNKDDVAYTNQRARNGRWHHEPVLDTRI